MGTVRNFVTFTGKQDDWIVHHLGGNTIKIFPYSKKAP